MILFQVISYIYRFVTVFHSLFIIDYNKAIAFLEHENESIDSGVSLCHYGELNKGYDALFIDPEQKVVLNQLRKIGKSRKKKNSNSLINLSSN